MTPTLFNDFLKLTAIQQKHIIALIYLSLPDHLKTLKAMVNCVEGFENGIVGFTIDKKGFMNIHSIRNIKFIESLQGNFTQRPPLVTVVTKYFNFVQRRYKKLQKEKKDLI